MNKNIYHRLSFVLSAFIFVVGFTFANTAPALAAGNAMLSIGPATRNVAVGQSFSLTLQIAANGENIDTARAQIQFPANLLRANNFALSSALPSTSPGNTIDNTNGVISWGGFSTGATINNTATLGTVSFTALGPGTATVQLGGGSRLISNGQEKINLGALGSSTIIIGGVTPTPGGPVVEDQIVITSPTHPNQEQWYNFSEATITWRPTIDIERYFWDFSPSPDTDPARELSSTTTEKRFTRLAEGINYFHLKGQLPDGSSTQIFQYLIRTDTSNPRPFEPYLEVDEDNALILRFATIDEVSGIDRYEVQINNQPFAISTSPLILEGLVIGENLVTIRAFDKAGNFRDGWIRFILNEDGTIREIAKSKATCSLAGLPFYFGFCCDYPLVCALLPWAVLILILLWLLWRNRKRKERKNHSSNFSGQ